MDSGLSFDASSEVFLGGERGLAAGGGNVRGKGRCIYCSTRSFWLLDILFHAFRVLALLLFHAFGH